MGMEGGLGSVSDKSDFFSPGALPFGNRPFIGKAPEGT
jgi:hypothetical protein